MAKKISVLGTGRKHKPAVAFSNQELATENIQAKIDYVNSVCGRCSEIIRLGSMESTGIDELLDGLPSSKRKFNSFSGRVVSSAGTFDLKRNSPDTLRANSILTAAVEKVLAIVADLKNPTQLNSIDEIKKASLKRQVTIAVKLRKIAEETIVFQKQKIIELHSENVVLENRLLALRRETENILSALRTENSLLKKKVSRQNNKVVLKVKEHALRVVE